MSPDRDVDIIAEIQTGATGLPTSNVVDNGFDMPIGVEQPSPAKIVFIEPPPVVDINGEGGVLRLQGSASVVNAEVQDIVSLNSISTVSKVITATQQIEIPNNAISNVSNNITNEEVNIQYSSILKVIDIANCIVRNLNLLCCCNCLRNSRDRIERYNISLLYTSPSPRDIS